jgi:hypothetical protein
MLAEGKEIARQYATGISDIWVRFELEELSTIQGVFQIIDLSLVHC